MKVIFSLWKPRIWSFRNGAVSRSARDRRARLYVFSTVGLVFWLGTYGIVYRVLTYFQGVEGFGDILAARLMYMIIMTFFSLLVFSGVITILTKLYLSGDLTLVHSLPAGHSELFTARWLESVVDSSWMVLLFSFPVFLAYGIIYQAGYEFYVIAFLSMVAMSMVAGGLAAPAVMAASVILPAGRIRTTVVVFGITLLLILIVSVRLLKPEQLVNPEAFMSVAFYLRSMEATGSPLLPTTWVYEAVHGALHGDTSGAVFNCALTWSLALSLLFINGWSSSVLYFPGFSHSRTTAERLLSGRHRERKRGVSFSFLARPVKAFVVKEIKTFFRDSSQWSQLFLVIALMVVYLYNYSVLPLNRAPMPTFYLQNLFSFLNMGLATFVMTAVAARFVFPAVSQEGKAFWIVSSSPVSIRTFIWVKFFVYLIPLVLMAEVLIVTTNVLLNVTTFMMVLSVVTVLLMTPGVVALGLGMGAAYPDFTSENPAQSVTSFGGVLYMMVSAAFIGAVTVLEAGPVYAFFMAGIRGKNPSVAQWTWMVVTAIAVLILCALAVYLPMRHGERKLSEGI